jgi:hypothetical protein
MSNLPTIPQMDNSSIDAVKRFENFSLQCPQEDIATQHLIHAGMYARTILVKKDTVITGALIKIPTILIINGHVVVTIGNEAIELVGHHVLPASKHRKQAFLTKEDTYITMVFATTANSVEEAEGEFTDEGDLLISRKTDASNEIVITGE